MTSYGFCPASSACPARHWYVQSYAPKRLLPNAMFAI